jgi:hypothetical protein
MPSYFHIGGGDLTLLDYIERGVSLMTVAEALSLMITFATFVVALITLVVHLIKMNNKK